MGQVVHGSRRTDTAAPGATLSGSAGHLCTNTTCKAPLREPLKGGVCGDKSEDAVLSRGSSGVHSGFGVELAEVGEKQGTWLAVRRVLDKVLDRRGLGSRTIRARVVPWHVQQSHAELSGNGTAHGHLVDLRRAVHQDQCPLRMFQGAELLTDDKASRHVVPPYHIPHHPRSCGRRPVLLKHLGRHTCCS